MIWGLNTQVMVSTIFPTIITSTRTRALLVVPYALDCNDMKFFHPNGFVTADEFIRYVRNGVDILLKEGERSSQNC